jgi:D-arabinose 1-dehydrogenase-like Zn-dependent alcohol dehydrogenase
VASNQGTKKEVAEALELVARYQLKPVIEMRKFKDINQGYQDLMGGKVAGRLLYKFE